jgi:hypothetical protein
LDVFLHRPSGTLIGFHKKVLYSFAAFHPEFEALTSERCDVLLWREPLERTVSLFFDKCRAAVKPDAVQDVQRVLLEAIGESQVEALRSVQFEDLVRLLPRVIELEDHFWPQTHGLDMRLIGEVVDIGWGLPRLGRRLGVDFRRRWNRSVHHRAASYYTPETRAIVEKLYAADYAVRPALPGSRRLLLRLMGLG